MRTLRGFFAVGLLLVGVLLLVAGGGLWMVTQHRDRALAAVQELPEWLASTTWGLPALGAVLLLVAVALLARPGRTPKVVYVTAPSGAATDRADPVPPWPPVRRHEATAIPVSAPPAAV